MIIEFSTKNFRSFKELATLSLEAESLKTGKEGLISTEIKINLLPAIGIFGHNASGKSNLIKALAYMQWAMLNSDYLNQPTTAFPFLQPFLLNVESSNEPSFFQIDLWDAENKTEYRYGFEINSEKVESNWIETTTKGQEFPEVDDSVKNSVGHLINNVRPTALALTVFAQFADPISSQVIKLVNRPNFMIFDGGSVDPMGYTLQQYHENPELALK